MEYIRHSRSTAVFDTPSAEMLPRTLPTSTAAFIRVREPFTQSGRSYIGFMDWVTLVVGRFRTTMDFEAVFPASLGEPFWNEATVTIHEAQMIQAAAAALDSVAR